MCTAKVSKHTVSTLTHAHPGNPSNETDSLIAILVNNGRICISLLHYQSSESRRKSRGHTGGGEDDREKKNGMNQTLDTPSGLRVVPDCCHDRSGDKTMLRTVLPIAKKRDLFYRR